MCVSYAHWCVACTLLDTSKHTKAVCRMHVCPNNPCPCHGFLGPSPHHRHCIAEYSSLHCSHLHVTASPSISVREFTHLQQVSQPVQRMKRRQAAACSRIAVALTLLRGCHGCGVRGSSRRGARIQRLQKHHGNLEPDRQPRLPAARHPPPAARRPPPAARGDPRAPPKTPRARTLNESSLVSEKRS